ncbi:MAG: transposase [Rhizobacter sp.]
MARLPRLLVPGQLHLVMQRSAGGQPVFRSDADAELYLAALRYLVREHEVLIHAYALLPNQVLMLLTPGHALSLSRLMQAQGRRFGAAYNRLHQREGVLWEGRFRATVLDPDGFGLAALQFVETAAARAGECLVASDYRWSSAAHHAGKHADTLITEHAVHWKLGNTPFERERAYRDSVHQLQPQALHEQIEAAAWRGWVLGAPSFIAALGELTHRRLTVLPQGRPRAVASKKD